MLLFSDVLVASIAFDFLLGDDHYFFLRFLARARPPFRPAFWISLLDRFAKFPGFTNLSWLFPPRDAISFRRSTDILAKPRLLVDDFVLVVINTLKNKVIFNAYILPVVFAELTDPFPPNGFFTFSPTSDWRTRSRRNPCSFTSKLFLVFCSWRSE